MRASVRFRAGRKGALVAQRGDGFLRHPLLVKALLIHIPGVGKLRPHAVIFGIFRAAGVEQPAIVVRQLHALPEKPLGVGKSPKAVARFILIKTRRVGFAVLHEELMQMLHIAPPVLFS